jgi:undecaprenyl-diphosphatase
LIQLGSILAILLVYFGRLVDIVKTLPRVRRTQHFVLAVLFAFLPAAVIGAVAHDFIKAVLFETPMLVCIVLIVGGFILLAVDRITSRPKYHDARDFSWPMAITIGFFSAWRWCPEHRAPALLSSVPCSLELTSVPRPSFRSFWRCRRWPVLLRWTYLRAGTTSAWNQGLLIIIGFVAAFLSALLVVRVMLDFVSRRGYALFAWWRIAVGSAGLAALLIFG